MSDPATHDSRHVYTVARLLQDVQQRLEREFGPVWLQGELSNVARPGSGHLYFTLKDSRAQIRCAMFKARNRSMSFEPAAGDAVLVRGRLGLYAARGDFQMIVEHMEPAGAGRLQAAFEALKSELQVLGWFSMQAKRPLPASPDTIGVITSPTGAALRDVLQVLNRRYPQGRVIVYPTLTQGEQAAANIVRALEQASRRRDADVLLLVRGGGSLEDLQAFNERRVAAAIRATPLPLVSGVGHEVDVTISDLVADLRAPTPSAAAELAVPDGSVLVDRAARARTALRVALSRHVKSAHQSHASLAGRLARKHPERLLLERSRHRDDLHERLVRRIATQRRDTQARTGQLLDRLLAHHPRRSLVRARERHEALDLRLRQSLQRLLSEQRDREQRLHRRLSSASPVRALDAAVRRHERSAQGLSRTVQQALLRRSVSLERLTTTLEAIGPQAVLARGYAMLEDRDGVLSSVNRVTPGERITARLADGAIGASVETVHRDTSEGAEELFPIGTNTGTD